MAELNVIPNCGVSGGGNTGKTDCPFQLKLFKGAFLTPAGFKIPQSTAEDPELLRTFLLDAARDPNPSLRIYPIHGFVGKPEDATEAPTIQTFGYGQPIPVREGEYAPSYQHYDGGLCLHKELRKFNSRGNMGVLFIDADNMLIGTTVKEGENYFLQAIPLTRFYARAATLPDGSAVAAYLLDFVFAKNYINDSPGFISTTGFDITSITGLQNVIVGVTGTAASEITATLKTSCGGVDLYDTYELEFEQLTAWVLAEPDGTPIAITSIAGNGNGAWVITTTAPLPTAWNLNIADPETLAAPPISVDGYEGLGYKKTV